eukprot:TRINITY_DN8189_c0_g2_i1.p1 TRINITY_DN8189_c0_g2~~TRINITY_DN8189_c0_g2_i1.p1  ORF type:complete len:209 (-),score=56.27 TRINITY_DN8189_c0_g2_i1:389-952(-)
MAADGAGRGGCGRGGGRGAGRGRGMASGVAEAPTPAAASKRPAPAQQPGAEGEATPAATPRGLTENVTGLRFMQTAKDEEQRKKQEKEQLAHLQEMQWVVPGFEAELCGFESSKRSGAAGDAPSAGKLGVSAPPPLQIHRRSYKGFNPYIEQTMAVLTKKHEQAMEASKDLLEASSLRAMKQRRVRQ